MDLKPALWFVGPDILTGRGNVLFQTALKTVGIDRTTVQISNELPVNAAVIVAFGNETLRRLVGDALPDEDITMLRGYFWDTPYGRVLGSVHPNDIVQNWTPWRALFDIDMRRARDEVATGAPPLTTREVITVVTPAQYEELLDAISDASRTASGTRRNDFLLSVDIENTEDFQLACCGFAPTPDKAWVIPANPGWQLDAIRELCESSWPKVFQNGQYDRLFNKLFPGIIVRNQRFDTQLAWHALNPELAGKKVAVGDKKARSKRTAKSLYFLGSIYLRAPWWKDYEFTTEEERFRLNGLDVCHTLEIAQKQRKQLAAQNLTHIHDFELDLIDPCLAMTERGMPVDETKRQAMLKDLTDAQAPLIEATAKFVVETVLPKFSDRLKPEKVHLFRERRVCACCRNGKAKRMACWECAGFEAKPTKKQLKVRADANMLTMAGPRTIVQDAVIIDISPLQPCAKCAGVGAFESTVFNPNSPEQTKIVLYELLRLPARTKNGKLTTDEKALKSLLPECAKLPEAHEFITKLLRLGKMTTISSILERIAPDASGRVHSIYNPAGTESGRFASAETFLMEASTNLNNMPKREAIEALFDVRACFVAPPGYVFVEADFSGAEMWIAAACCQDDEWLHALRTEPKIHKWHAQKLFGLEEVSEQNYMKAKTAGLALNYGMQWKTFMENVNAVADRTGVSVTAHEAKQICAGYTERLHPSLPRWWKRGHTELMAHGTMTTCFGRKRTFYGRNRHEYLGEAHREYIANEPQSTIADLLNRGLLRWWRQHDGKIGELLAQVYDSVLILAREERAELCAAFVKRCLTEEIEVHGVKLTVPVDVKIVKSLAVMKEAA